MTVRAGRARVGLVVAAGVLAAAALHAATPAGPHSWHALHIVSQKLYYAPILMAAAWLGLGPALVTTLAVSALYGVHILADWAGLPMVQAEKLGEIASFWLVAVLSGVLFRRQRLALEQVREAHEETLAALASSLELRERYTAGHSRRVRDYALLLADALEIRDDRFRENLATGALLHDVGKIGIPDKILLKGGALTDEERQEMRSHPELGAALIGRTGFLSTARDLVRAHHERWDGAGYPRRLAGSGIPLAARIFSVVDTFDALTTDRPYHRALSYEEAAGLIAEGRGTQFDPLVVDAFLHVPFETWFRAAEATGAVLERMGRVESMGEARWAT